MSAIPGAVADPPVGTYYAMTWCGGDGYFSDETAQAHYDGCTACQREHAIFEDDDTDGDCGCAPLASTHLMCV